ncbi:MAG: MATE family efflux transporter [Lachnospiraceae bacterium]|nr:MATE family efflux transporter [Lachnospiraceae bacterium]
MKSKSIDMTEGSIVNRVLMFALPIILGNILQQLYTTVDVLIIGHYCGDTSMAAVGTSSQPVEVLLCIFMGMGAGVSILVSQCIGAKDMKRVAGLVKTAHSFVYIAGILLTVAGYFFAPLMLRLMKVPDDVFVTAVVYTRFVFAGTIGNIGYNLNAGILRGIGDSKASLRFLVISCVTNICLDYILVAVAGMDVEGAALATSVAMFVSWFASIAYIRKNAPGLCMTVLPSGFDSGYFKKIVKLGLPMGLNNSLYSFGHVAMQTMINAQGAAFMAGVAAASRYTGLANISVTALSGASTTFAGQNYGAGKYDRLRKGQYVIPFMSGAVTLALGLLMTGIRMPVMRLFTNTEEVLFYAGRYAVVILLSQWMFGVFNSMMSMANGVGSVKYTVVVNILLLWAVRIPAAGFICRYMDGTWLMLSIPASFFIGMVCMILYFVFSPYWKKLVGTKT